MPIYYYGSGTAKERFQHFLDNPPEAISIDIETPTVTERMPLGFAIAFSPDEAFYFQVHPEAPRELELLKPLLFNPAVCKIAHYALFDLSVMPLIPQLVGFDRCLHPNTKVLRCDLTWDKISNIKVGDSLIGIDETALGAKQGRTRRLRNTRVTSTSKVTLPAFLIILDNGRDLITSAEHPWLARRGITRGSTDEWIRTSDLKIGNYLRDGFDVWETDTSYDAGRISGLLDGEGCVVASRNNSIIFGVTDKDITDDYIRILKSKGFCYSRYDRTLASGKVIVQIKIQNQRDTTRLMGSIRPKRLLKNFTLDGRELVDRNSHTRIVDIIKLPESMEMVAIQTTGKTFVAEGILTHNSNIFDTNTAARLLGKELTALTILAPDVDMIAEDAKSFMQRFKVSNMLDAPVMEVANKCQMDAKVAFGLYLDYKPKMDSQYPEYFKIEMEVIPILIDLSMGGLSIDQGARADLQAKLEDEVEFYRRQLEEYGVEKPGSTQQVGYMLGKRGNFLPMTRSKRQLSTREADLEFLNDPMAAAVLGWRGKSKLLNTYISPIAGDDRFYTEYYLDTVVGRLNSRNRNIQNIPPECRYIFLPDNGCFTTGDYSQEHPRILAVVSQDREMLRVFENGEDIHLNTAKQLRISRTLAKRVNNAMHGGATAETVSTHTKIRDKNLCSKFIDDWSRVYRSAWDWIQYAQREGVKNGWSLPTLFGRSIRIPDEYTKWGRLNTDAMKRKSSSYPILGSDGEVMKRAIILCYKKGLKPPVMAATVHDSLTFDGDVELPVEELEMIPGFTIPFEVKKTLRWE